MVDPAPGRYVLRVVYYTAPANDWTATVMRQRRDPDRVDPTGKRESYTLTCAAPDGTVLGRSTVTVDRGQRLAVDVPGCTRGESAGAEGSRQNSRWN